MVSTWSFLTGDASENGNSGPVRGGAKHGNEGSKSDQFEHASVKGASDTLSGGADVLLSSFATETATHSTQPADIWVATYGKSIGTLRPFPALFFSGFFLVTRTLLTSSSRCAQVSVCYTRRKILRLEQLYLDSSLTQKKSMIVWTVNWEFGVSHHVKYSVCKTELSVCVSSWNWTDERILVWQTERSITQNESSVWQTGCMGWSGMPKFSVENRKHRKLWWVSKCGADWHRKSWVAIRIWGLLHDSSKRFPPRRRGGFGVLPRKVIKN